MKEGKLSLGIDFDGTIVEHEFPKIGKAKKGAIKAIQALDKAGFKIVINTVRSNRQVNPDCDKLIQDMEDWLKENKVPYDEVWRGEGKPFCHIFLDDSAIPFTDWAQALTVLITLLKKGNDVKSV